MGVRLGGLAPLTPPFKQGVRSSNLRRVTTSLRTAYCSQRLFMLRMKSHFSLISSQLLPKSQSLTLDCDFVFLIWQLIHSVQITHVAADCISFAATFYASHEKSLLTRFVAAPPKIAIADAGLRFCFSNLAVDP